MGCCFDKIIETDDEFLIFKQIEFKIRVNDDSNKNSNIKYLASNSELLQELLYIRSLIRNRYYPIIINIRPYIILKSNMRFYRNLIANLKDIQWSENSLVIQNKDYELVIGCFHELDEKLKENIKAYILELYTI